MTKHHTNPSNKLARTVHSFLFSASATSIIGISMLLTPVPSVAEETGNEVIVYKDASCECCGRWVSHMRQNGFSVTVKNMDDMSLIKSLTGIPENMESCHTASIGNYLVEGHVPASDVKRMLTQKPAIKGLAVPGMPMSAPGMDSPENEPYTVFSFDSKGSVKTYAAY